MKSTIKLLIAASAIFTLSFSFVSTKEIKKNSKGMIKSVASAPAGGFAIEDRL